MFSFIHLSDTHFGNEYLHLPPITRKQIKYKKKKAFEKMIDQAIEKNVDCILHAGDLFDKKSVENEDIHFVSSMMSRLKTERIPFVLASGNHDPNIHSLRKMFPSMIVFSTEKVSTVQIKDYHIYGISHGQRDHRPLYSHLKNLPKKGKNIVVVHSNIVGSSLEHENYLPMSKRELQSIDAEYVALGHIHQSIDFAFKNGAQYSGSFFPNSFKDLGERGYYYVELGEIQQKLFIPSSPVTFERDSLTFDGSKINAKDLQRMLYERANYNQVLQLDVSLVFSDDRFEIQSLLNECLKDKLFLHLEWTFHVAQKGEEHPLLKEKVTLTEEDFLVVEKLQIEQDVDLLKKYNENKKYYENRLLERFIKS